VRFRVGTFNLHQGLRRWDSRRLLIAQQLVELRADVLCLNEVSIPLDSGRWLWRTARDLGLAYAYLEQTKTGALSMDEGQAILSRFPVLESASLDYRSRDRIAQVARLDLDGKSLDVYLTHLHHVRQEDAIREFMVGLLLDWIGRREAKPPTLALSAATSMPRPRCDRSSTWGTGSPPRNWLPRSQLRYAIGSIQMRKILGSTSGRSRRVSITSRTKCLCAW
jgi:hypothetical protein